MNIWVAASDGNIDKVKSFIENGQSANDKDVNGYTPMHAAASYAHVELIRYLITVGGDINLVDEEGDSPLHVVEDVGMAKIMVEELGADPKLKNNDGETALQKIEEEDEFPELILYLRTLDPNESSTEDKNIIDSLPSNGNLRYTVDASNDEEDLERKARIEQIMQSENPEEGLRQLVQEVVHGQLNGSNESVPHDSPNRKKTRTDD